MRPRRLLMAAALLLAPAACSRPSTPERTQAVAAFATVQRVFQHPRCQNCHILGDAPLQFDAGVPHALAVTRGPAWVPVGTALHLANGAAFGALYANLAPRLPLPSWARGPAAALAEHLSTWPLMGVSDSLHPARDDMPRLVASPRAFAQATWRHLLFGIVLGELERRLNGPEAPEMPDYESVVSSNGHGRFEPAVSTQ